MRWMLTRRELLKAGLTTAVVGAAGAHAVADFLPITAKQNPCKDCHAVQAKKSGEPTPIPASHYTAFRNAPDRIGAQVAGAR